jgi:raffinose/stachyose/melibiose transport system permease protein
MALRLAGRSARWAFLAIVGLACLGPVAWVVLSSFKTQAQVFGAGNLLPSPFSLDGFRALFTQIDVGSYLAARMQFPFRRSLTVLFSVGLAVPVTGLIVPEFVIMQHLELLNTRVGMVLFYSAMWFPLSFVILRAFLSGLPPSLEEAAALDGAGYFQLLRRVILPLARPGLATAAVLVFINIWNDFLFNLLLAPSAQVQNVQVGLAQFRGQFRTDITAILAGTTVMMIIPVITFVVLQRYVIAGLTAGSSR